VKLEENMLAIDLYCGLGGWAEGFLADGYDVIGFDIEIRPYPGHLVIQDARSLHGSQFKNASVIVASPPCQEYSYRAMPWKRARALPPPSNELFDTCFRLQREACEAAGRYIPMVVENVKGAQPWVGPAKWHYGSYFLWGDVPALMPFTSKDQKFNPDGTNHAPGSWFKIADSNNGGSRIGSESIKMHGSGAAWFDSGFTKFSSKSERRKMASALIAKIPFPLARHIAQVYKNGHLR
jgi:hypothetical protein